MNQIIRDPWADFRSLRQEMNRLFHNPALAAAADDDASAIATSVWAPAVDLKEDENQFTLLADVPGVNPQDIEITMEGGVLTIRGERLREAAENGRAFRRVERSYGAFYRRFSLPDTAAEDRVEATCRNGVLEVVIPKQERARPRQVEVKTA